MKTKKSLKSRPVQFISRIGIFTVVLIISIVHCTRDIEIRDIEFAYKTLLDSESFCKHKRAIIYSDKSVYKPGEVIYFTVYYYNLMSKQPLSSCKTNIYNSVSIYDVNDKFITSLQTDTQKAHPDLYQIEIEDYSSMFYSYEVPKDILGGVFTAKISNSPDDEMSFFIMAYNNKKIALIGDWNTDFAKVNDLLKGKLTLKVLTRDNLNLEKPEIKYRWSDAEGKELYTRTEKLIENSLQVNYKIPSFNSPLLFSAEVTAGEFTTVYKKEFLEPSFKDIVVDFNILTGKIVKDLPNKIYYQAFATSKRDAPTSFTTARVMKTVLGKTTVILPSVSSDSFGKGFFELHVTENDLSSNALFELEVKYDSDNVFKYAIFDISKLQFSPLLLNIKNLYYGNSDTLFAEIRSLGKFTQEVTFIIQNKSKVLYNQVWFFPRNKHTAKEQTKKIEVSFESLDIRQGGVFTLQLYINSSSVKKEDQTKNYETPKDNKLKNDANINEPNIPLFAPKTSKSINFLGTLVQEIDIFIEPENIICANVELAKDFYIPGEKVEFVISQKRNGFRCLEDYLTDLKAIVLVTDESAFLEIEKSREASSMFTKLFLEKEILSSAERLPYSNKYIDHIFNHQVKPAKEELAEMKRNVELLMGNASHRKFLFDPSNLEKYIQQPYDEFFKDVRNLYDYLIPKEQESIIQPFFINNKFLARNAGNAVPLQVDRAEMAPGVIEEKIINTPILNNGTPLGDAKSVQNEEKLLKYDTIYHEFKHPKNNRIIGNFDLPSQVTNFSVRVLLYNSEGIYGYTEKSVKVRKPINVIVDAPLFIYKDETFKIPVVVENNQNKQMEINFINPTKVTKTIKANSSISEVFEISKSNLPLAININDITGNSVADFVIDPRVLNPGIIAIDGASGFIELGSSSASLSYNSLISKELIKGNNKLEVCYRNSVLSIILDTIKQFNRIPTGCFEQASTTTFPIIVGLKVLKRLPQTPEIIKLKEELLENLKKGIKLLLTYECKSGGFEWFGSDPGHSTLTAYGLWQFYEIEQIDSSLFEPSLLSRLQDFLEKQRDQKGGFIITNGLDALGNPEKLVSDVFVLYVLSKQASDLKRIFRIEYESALEIYKEFQVGKRTLDSYKLAVIGLLFFNTGNEDLAIKIIEELSLHQNSLGEIQKSETSITRSSGASLAVETTALTLILALNLKSDDLKPFMARCVMYISENLKKVFYQSTQATILSLIAIEKYLATFASNGKESIKFNVHINNRKVDKFEINPGNNLQGDLCTDLSSSLIEIENKNEDLHVKIDYEPTFETKGQYFFDIHYEYYSGLPNSSSKSPLEATITKKEQNNVSVYTLKVHNKQNREEGMLIVEFNRPSCYDFNINDLETLRSKGDIAYYELKENNRIVVFYYKGIRAQETKTFSVSLAKRFTQTTCNERAHSIYLYYDKDGSILYRKA